MTKKEKQTILQFLNEKESEIQRTENRLRKLYNNEEPDMNRIDLLEQRQYVRSCARNAIVETLQILCNDNERVKLDPVKVSWFIYSTIHDDLNIYEKEEQKK